MTVEDAQERVARGAALLDQHVPDWPTRIILNRFDLSNPCECVIGQCFGHFGKGFAFDWFPQSSWVDKPSDTDAVGCGFDLFVATSNPDDDWRTLQDAWVEAIDARLLPPATWTHREPQTNQRERPHVSQRT